MERPSNFPPDRLHVNRLCYPERERHIPLPPVDPRLAIVVITDVDHPSHRADRVTRGLVCHAPLEAGTTLGWWAGAVSFSDGTTSAAPPHAVKLGNDTAVDARHCGNILSCVNGARTSRHRTQYANVALAPPETVPGYICTMARRMVVTRAIPRMTEILLDVPVPVPRVRDDVYTVGDMVEVNMDHYADGDIDLASSSYPALVVGKVGCHGRALVRLAGGAEEFEAHVDHMQRPHAPTSVDNCDFVAGDAVEVEWKNKGWWRSRVVRRVGKRKYRIENERKFDGVPNEITVTHDDVRRARQHR